MQHLIVHHHVKDYAAWKPVFDENRSALEAAGCRSIELFRSSEDPNDLVVHVAFEDAEHARAFFASDYLKDSMARAGVMGQPEFLYVDEVEQVELGAPAARAA